MTAELGSRSELRRQLAVELCTREDALQLLLSAHAAGDLETALTLRSTALSLHSLKGTLALLGLTGPAAHLAELPRAMREANDAPDAFWRDYAAWMSRFFEQCRRALDEDVDFVELAELKNQVCKSLGDMNHRAPARRASSELTLDLMSASAGRRVLVIDDSAVVRAVVSARLGDRGYPVRSATSLAEAQSICRTFSPEIIVCDIQIPGMTGEEICEHLKSQLQERVCVIFYSSLSEQELAERAARGGADDHACKLAGFDALLAAMDRVIDERTP